jgi:hypothetical protein
MAGNNVYNWHDFATGRYQPHKPGYKPPLFNQSVNHFSQQFYTASFAE